MTVIAADFEVVRRLVYARAAIVLEPGKEYLVTARLGPLARAEGCSIGQLIRRLRSPAERALAARVVEAMTTNETAFFRDGKPWETLRSTVLPELIARRTCNRQLSVWCAASSSGQEPYTVAMVLREHFPQLRSWTVRILCTDVSEEMVARTRVGHYSQLEAGRGLPAALRQKYFSRQGDGWQVSPDLQRPLEVRTLNLAEPWGAIGTMDIIVCRNVLIYFDTETKRSVLRRIRRQLSPDGFLFLGAGETLRGSEDGFEPLGPGTGGCYRIPGAARRGARRAS